MCSIVVCGGGDESGAQIFNWRDRGNRMVEHSKHFDVNWCSTDFKSRLEFDDEDVNEIDVEELRGLYKRVYVMWSLDV